MHCLSPPLLAAAQKMLALLYVCVYVYDGHDHTRSTCSRSIWAIWPVYKNKEKYTPAVRSKILSKLIFAS